MTSVIDWDKAQRRRDRGMASAVRHTCEEAPGWPDRAYGYLQRYAGLDLEPWTIEQFRAWAIEQGLDRPAEERAYGGVTQRALRNGLIVRVGYAPAASSNGSAKALYARPALGEVA